MNNLIRGAIGLSAVCNCGISGSYSLTILRDFLRVKEWLIYYIQKENIKGKHK